jgi:hypothetical protein
MHYISFVKVTEGFCDSPEKLFGFRFLHSVLRFGK